MAAALGAEFAMVIAQLAHIVEEGYQRWPGAFTDKARADNEAWVREFIDRSLTRAMIDRLVAGRPCRTRARARSLEDHLEAG